MDSGVSLAQSPLSRSRAYPSERTSVDHTNLCGRPGYKELSGHLQARLEELRKETNDTYPYQPTGLPLHPGEFRQGKVIGGQRC
jgi:hypothetical protein